MRFERYYKREPIDMSSEKLGFDILSKERFIEVKTSLKKEAPTFTPQEIDFLTAKEKINEKKENWINELKKRWIYYIGVDKEILKYTKYSYMIYSYAISLYTISSYEVLTANSKIMNLMEKSGEYELLRILYGSFFRKSFESLKPLTITPSEQIITLLKILEQLIYALDEYKYDGMF